MAFGGELAVSTASNSSVLGMQKMFVPWIFIIVLPGIEYSYAF